MTWPAAMGLGRGSLRLCSRCWFRSDRRCHRPHRRRSVPRNRISVPWRKRWSIGKITRLFAIRCRSDPDRSRAGKHAAVGRGGRQTTAGTWTGDLDRSTPATRGEDMNSEMTAESTRTPPSVPEMTRLLDRYGCGPVQFSGSGDGLYERHLLFDNVVDPAAVGPRERYEAVARSIRDILSQRWLRTEQTYEQENPKRVYYLSMEFLIGRSLANNILNLLLDPVVRRLADGKGLDWPAMLEQEPDAGLGNGGLGRLAACFLDSMATMQLPAMGYGLRYEYGIFKQTIRDGWQHEQPDNWLRRPDPWEIVRPQETVEVKLGCSFEVRGGTLGVVIGQPSSLLGIPFDRPVVGYGGKTINTLRLWAAAAPDFFDFQAFSAGEFVSALGRAARGRVPDAGSLPRRLHEHGAGAALRAGVLPRRLLAGGSPAALPPQQRRLERFPRQDRHPAQRHPPQPGRSRADADPARRGAPRMGPGLGSHPTRRSPTRTTRSCPRRWRSGPCGGSNCCCRVTWRSSSRSTAGSSRRCGPAFRATRAASGA